MIATATSDSAIFQTLTPEQRADVVDAMFEMKFQPGDVVIRQGDVGDNLYVVDSGEYSVFLSQVGDKPVHHYKASDTFGELALMYNCPRAASIIADSAGSCWALDRNTFRHIVMAANKESMDSTASFLKSVSLLSPLTDAQRDALGTVLEELEFGPRETIVREGDMADALYLIKSGEVIAYKADNGDPKGRELGRMKQLEFFGESSLEADGERRQASVVSAGKVKMLKLTRANFTELLGELRDVIKFNFNQKVLGSMEIFRELSDTEKGLLVDSLVEIPYKTTEPIITQGEVGDAFYIIKTGSVAVLRTNEAGEQQVVKDKLGPSDYFGEMAMMKEEPRMASVVATSPTVCMKLDKSTFQSLLGKDIGRDILKREADRRAAELERASRPKILMSELKQLSILGVGTFGRVKLVLHEKDDNKPYALKCMRKGQVIALKQVEHVMNEKNLLEQCDHPFLLRLAATFQDNEEIYMLLELALGGVTP